MYSRRGSLPEGAIPLEIWSGNDAIKARLDAVPWLRRAAQAEVDVLLSTGWGGRGREAVLVRFFESRSEEVEIVVRYSGQVGADVCFLLDRDAAVAWVKRHRPELQIRGASEPDGAAGDRSTLSRPATGAATPERLQFLRERRRA